MQITQGTYAKGITTEANSLVANLNKYPEIERTLVDQYPQYVMTWLFEKLNAFDGGKVLKDNSYEWKLRGRLDRPFITANKAIGGGATDYTNLAPITLIGADTATVEATKNHVFSFTVKNDAAAGTEAWGQPNDLIRFNYSNAQAIVTSVLPDTSTTRIVNAKLIYGIVKEGDLRDGNTVAIIGNAFGENSNDAYEHSVYESTQRNWVTTSRKKKSITGDAFTNVSWLEYKGNKLWYFEQEDIMKKQFKLLLERRLWFARSGMDSSAAQATDPAGSNLYPGGSAGNHILDWDPADTVNSTPPTIGDGLEAQIDAANDVSWNVELGLTEDSITDYISLLAQNGSSNGQGNRWVVPCGMIYRRAFDRAMKDISGGKKYAGGALSDNKGMDVKLGASFTTYEALGNEFVLVNHPMFNDPNLYGANRVDGLTGSGDAFFLDFGSYNGLQNIRLISKYQRSYIHKYIPGMMNPFDPSSMMAAHAGDRFETQVLAQLGVIVHNPISCGIHRGTK